MTSFTVGAVVAYLLVCFAYGKLLPALSLPTILSVTIGGICGQLIQWVLCRDRKTYHSSVNEGKVCPRCGSHAWEHGYCSACELKHTSPVSTSESLTENVPKCDEPSAAGYEEMETLVSRGETSKALLRYQKLTGCSFEDAMTWLRRVKAHTNKEP